MAQVIFAVILSIITFALTKAASTKNVAPTTTTQAYMSTESTMTTPGDQDSSIDSTEFDTAAIMNMCNDSFRIEMSYLESLNMSGSFIDETDKTPKMVTSANVNETAPCFLRCVLENTGILSVDGQQFNTARAATIFAGERNGKPMDDLSDMTALCANREETCPCDRAYKFLRCLMSMEIERYETVT